MSPPLEGLGAGQRAVGWAESAPLTSTTSRAILGLPRPPDETNLQGPLSARRRSAFAVYCVSHVREGEGVLYT